jgi:hypothetical protein
MDSHPVMVVPREAQDACVDARARVPATRAVSLRTP